jgi:hypothetical protein
MRRVDDRIMIDDKQSIQDDNHIQNSISETKYNHIMWREGKTGKKYEQSSNEY